MDGDLKEASMEETNIGRVLVVGAGVAGIRAALDLAEVGYRVLLTDSSPAIGGILAKLDHQFPSDHCGMCKMLPVVGREYASQYCMRKGLFHDNIRILPFTEVRAIRGDPGSYEIDLLRRARHVDTDICVGTGYCTDVCPIEVVDEFNQGLTVRKAIYRPVPHNLPNMYLIDANACDKCGECVKVCPVDAINLDAADEELTTGVDAIILATGTELFDPAEFPEQTAYTRSPNVVTALEFERLISASGSYDGTLRRPGDGATAHKLAWLQCVGSRNRKEGRDFCSSVCCMFALKEAVLAHEKGPEDVETTIFYMDMRTYGKDFYRYREYAEEEHGVRLVRCRSHAVEPLEDGQLAVRYWDDAAEAFVTENYDLVVLSTGQRPPRAAVELGGLLGIEPSEAGYLSPVGFEKVRSQREGVFLCGSFMGLTDISESLTSGSAAAGEACKLMISMGKEPKGEPVLPAERDNVRELANVAVVLCRWNHGKLPPNVNLEDLAEMLLKRAGVGEVHIVDELCRGEGYDKALAVLGESQCNRVLFGACLPYIYRKRLKNMAREAGFSPTFVDVADIRGLILRAAVEKDIPALLRKVRSLLTVSVEKLKRAEPVETHTMDVEQKALVVGGGIAGMRAALSLADRGIEVHLVERTDELGGRPLRRLHYTLDGLDPKALAAETQQRIWEHRLITVHRNAEVLRSSGSLGRFRTVIQYGSSETIEVLHGATIIATGGHEAATVEYQYAQSDTIVTQGELEEGLATGAIDPKGLNKVVMIQCVGSREKGAHDYCSRVCCAAALKNSFKIREANPDTRIIVLYRDLMAYGGLERFYTKARGAGVLFASYDPEAKPRVEVGEEGPVVTWDDSILGQPISMKTDLLVLSTAIEPDASNVSLGEILGVDLTQDGFFQEADSKWRPVDFAREGLFLVGTAHSPSPIMDAICQAEAAAQRAYTYLSKPQVTTARVVSRVHEALCALCEQCITICPHDARSIDEQNHKLVVDEAACQGCGMCAMVCPNSASEMLGFGDKQIMAVIDASLAELPQRLY